MSMGDTKVRIIGAVVLILGVVLAYYFGYMPLEAARSHAPEVNLSLKAVFLAPAFILFGAFTAAAGRRGREWLQVETPGARRKLKPAGWVLVLVCIAAGIALHQSLERSIKALGYTF
jgi:hypothetical protein